MKNKKKIIAIIPARSGSKGLLNKNIKLFNKKPLIYWTIKSALQSKYIDKCFVSTDSKKISNLSKKFGADSSFLRPKNISGHQSDISSTIIHTLKKFNNDYDIIILLQPTSPLRDVKDINQSLELFINKKLNTLISISKLDYPYEWILDKNKNNNIKFINKKKFSNRQQTKLFYKANGAIYISKVDDYIKNKNFFNKDTYGFYMKNSKSIDIDNEFEFKFAEILKNNNV